MEALLRQRRLLLTSLHDMAIFRQEETHSSPGPVRLPLRKMSLRWSVWRSFALCVLPLSVPRVWQGLNRWGEEAQDAVHALPKRCNYADCCAYAWNDPVAAVVVRCKREQCRACP